ncbi:NACHT domain-containing protein [Nostoc sp. UHCC 0870]|uniref:NACHT domain-containing protein n=1 Tax=Nostoc sp. UHCC 0870 TaxID=2914041 RepID=UPI001EDD2FC8|nr:NACHT domain-containing protein [Nostoc sp. UHCC 0870]UKO95965.1 NACHT domain-containing protein [Nostoc sp. UHCC 0870]
MESFGIPGAALTPVLSAIAKEIIKKAQSRWNPTELEKSLKAAIKAAQDEEKKRLQKGLFSYCDDKKTADFLAKVFKCSTVKQELEKPLTDKFPDIPNLIAAFTQIAQDLKISLNEVGLKPWLWTFSNTYFQKSPAYIRYKTTKENYFNQIKIHSEKIHFAGIKVSGEDRDISEQLVKIFVMPDVIKEENNTQPIITSNDAYIAANTLLINSPIQQMVILGEPGSGKSTLMQYFALDFASNAEHDLLPILIQIRDLAKYVENNILSYLQEIIPKKYNLTDIPNGFFDYWLKQGKALILLDGLDEIADENKRREVVRLLYSFIKDSQYAQNRVIITSRPAEYERYFFKTNEFPHYIIQPFDEPKINLFIDKWHNSRFPDLVESDRWQTSLKNVLNSQERIKLLVQNPLLLTLVCLIHRYDVYRLPQKRHHLYEAAVKTLLMSWDMNKAEPLDQRLIYVKPDDLQRLMEQLAYWIHSQKSQADINSSTIVERREIVDKLSQDIKNLRQIELYQAKQEAEKFIKYISARSGLLNEQGQECYAFGHKTFQEYLCAQEIDYRRQNDDDFGIVLEHIKDHLHDPHWREVLLLLIVIQKPKPIAKAIKFILDLDTDKPELYHHNLLFAASCLAEDPKDLRTVENEPSSQILRELANLEINPDLDEEIRSQVFLSFCNLSQTQFAKSALQILSDNEANIDEQRMQQYLSKL